MKHCEWCKKEITKKKNIFCDMKCLRAWNKSMKVKMTCTVCSKPYFVSESKSLITKACSVDCRNHLAGIGGRKANIAKAEVVTFNCLQCLKPFDIYKSRSIWEKNGTQGKRKFCCKACQLQHRKDNSKKISIICKQCGIEKLVDSYRTNAKFCCVQCKYDYEKTLTGTKSKSYKTGYKTYRRDALKLFEYKCYNCKKVHRRLQVHHIDGNNKNNTPKNWVVLCLTCHRRVHLGRIVLPEVVVVNPTSDAQD